MKKWKKGEEKEKKRKDNGKGKWSKEEKRK